MRRTGGVLSRLAVTGLAAWFMAPIPAAHACSGPVCTPEYFLPYEGSLPVNARGIQWQPGWYYEWDAGAQQVTDSGALSFRCEGAARTTRDIAFHVEGDGVTRMIVADEPLVVRDRCEIRTDFLACEGLGYYSTAPPSGYFTSEAKFRVSEPQPTPQILGALHAQPAALQQATVSSGVGCDGVIEVCGVAVDLDLDVQAVGWRDAFIYETFVDGERWDIQRNYNFQNVTGGSFVGRGKDLIFVPPPYDDSAIDHPDITPGTHTVIMRATLPGTDLLLETAAIEINLDCGDQMMLDAGDHSDAGVVPDSSTGLDAGVASAPSNDGGCSCSIVGPRANHSFAWAWSLAVIALLAVRRVRARQTRKARPHA